MATTRELRPGTRVRLRAPDPTLTLESDRGSIVGPDEYLDYYVVRLDRPAKLRHDPDDIEWLDEVVEDIDNLEIVSE